jgi:hypothetical protein
MQKQLKYFVFLLLFLGIFSSTAACLRDAIIPRFPLEVTLRPVEAPQGIAISFYEQESPILPDVVAATKFALRVNEQWGRMTETMHLRLFPTHESLEEAIQLRLPWVKAWARYDEVWLRSPRTWRRKMYQWPLTELITHEMNHLLMFQLCCTRETWEKSRIPLWFREGMASVTAGQGHYRLSLERLRSFFLTPQGKRVMNDPESRYALQYHQSELYSLGHWMFEDLLAQAKHAKLKALFASMKQGKSFVQAFREMVGMSVEKYVLDFQKKNFQGADLARFFEMPRSLRVAKQEASFVQPHRCLFHGQAD